MEIRQIKCPENLEEVLVGIENEDDFRIMAGVEELEEEITTCAEGLIDETQKTLDAARFMRECGNTYEEVLAVLRTHVINCKKCKAEYGRYSDKSTETQLRFMPELAHSREPSVRDFAGKQTAQGYLGLVKRFDPLRIYPQDTRTASKPEPCQ